MIDIDQLPPVYIAPARAARYAAALVSYTLGWITGRGWWLARFTWAAFAQGFTDGFGSTSRPSDHQSKLD